MRGVSLPLMVAGLVLLAAAAGVPAQVAARPAKLLLFDGRPPSEVTVQWVTSVSYEGEVLRSNKTVVHTPTNGSYELPIPTLSSCGAITASINLGWVEGIRSGGRCRRPTMDLTSATISGRSQAYCATTFYRSCNFWVCVCRTGFTIRAVVLSDGGRPMALFQPGDFRACGDLTAREVAAAKRAGAVGV